MQPRRHDRREGHRRHVAAHRADERQGREHDDLVAPEQGEGERHAEHAGAAVDRDAAEERQDDGDAGEQEHARNRQRADDDRAPQARERHHLDEHADADEDADDRQDLADAGAGGRDASERAARRPGRAALPIRKVSGRRGSGNHCGSALRPDHEDDDRGERQVQQQAAAAPDGAVAEVPPGFPPRPRASLVRSIPRQREPDRRQDRRDDGEHASAPGRSRRTACRCRRR